MTSTLRPPTAPTLVIALGGNAIARPGVEPTTRAQFKRTRETAELLVPIIASGRWRIVITHGNGPQVGNILLGSELAVQAGELPPTPIDIAVADTQGSMGYMIGQTLANTLWESGLRRPIATVVTQIIVDEDDEAFAHPTKPIGRFYPRSRRGELDALGWHLIDDGEGRGLRRVVPSPDPREIVEEETVRELIDAGVIVIACGGGGIPVVAGEGGSLAGVEAVIDKDLASSLLAVHVGAEVFAIATNTDAIHLHHGTPAQRRLVTVTPDELKAYSTEGHFAAGSMAPKVDAVIRYVEATGGRAVVCGTHDLAGALEGNSGTQIVPAERAWATAK